MRRLGLASRGQLGTTRATRRYSREFAQVSDHQRGHRGCDRNTGGRLTLGHGRRGWCARVPHFRSPSFIKRSGASPRSLEDRLIFFTSVETQHSRFTGSFDRLQPSPGPLAHGPRQSSPACSARAPAPAHAMHACMRTSRSPGCRTLSAEVFPFAAPSHHIQVYSEYYMMPKLGRCFAHMRRGAIALVG